MIEYLERAPYEQVEACFSVPPRHFKSTTLFHAIARWLKERPWLRIAYVSYGHDIASKQVAKARRICERAGIELGEIQRQGYWETTAGGCVTAQGVRGQLTGEGFHVILVDDPHKNREEAESGVVRRRVLDGFDDDIYTRREPGGTSVFVVHTRWHPSDLIGELFERGWHYVNLPAINSSGEALCPDFWPLEELDKYRANEYGWASLFMGQPRPRGKELFADPVTCTLADIPTTGRDAIGVDLAYTAKTQADYSVALVLRKVGEDLFVADCKRKQVQAPEFGDTLRTLAMVHAGAPMRWYCSGTEKGSAQFIQRSGVPLQAETTQADKMVRALPVSAAWNAGRIKVPRDAPWAAALIAEVTAFTGVNDPHDDIVDALAAAFDAFGSAPPAIRRDQPKLSDARKIGGIWG